MKIKKNLTKDIKMFIKRGDGQILSVVNPDLKSKEEKSEKIEKEESELKNKKDTKKN